MKKFFEKVKDVAKKIKDAIVAALKKAKEALDKFLDWCYEHPMFTMIVAFIGGVLVLDKLAARCGDNDIPVHVPTREEKLNRYIDNELYKANHRNEYDTEDHMKNVRDAMLTLSTLKRLNTEEKKEEAEAPILDPITV